MDEGIPQIIAGCLFFGSIIYWLFRRAWKVVMPDKKISINIFTGIMITATVLFVII